MVTSNSGKDPQKRAILLALNSALGGGAKCGQTRTPVAGRGGRRTAGFCEHWRSASSRSAAQKVGTSAAKGPLEALGVTVPGRRQRFSPNLEAIKESAQLAAAWAASSCACDPTSSDGDEEPSSTELAATDTGKSRQAAAALQRYGVGRNDTISALSGGVARSSAAVLQKYASSGVGRIAKDSLACSFTPNLTVDIPIDCVEGLQSSTGDISCGHRVTKKPAETIVVGSMQVDSDSEESSSSSSSSSSPPSSP